MAVKAGHVQLKVIVPERTRETVRLHAEQNGTDMSTTIARVVHEVLFPELTDARRLQLKDMV
jgi:hypothetical protein